MCFWSETSSLKQSPTWNAEHESVQRADGGMHTCGFGWSGWMLRALGIQKDSSLQPTLPQCSHMSLWTQGWHPASGHSIPRRLPNQTDIGSSFIPWRARRKCRMTVEKLKCQGIPDCLGPPNKITMSGNWTFLNNLDASVTRTWETV